MDTSSASLPWDFALGKVTDLVLHTFLPIFQIPFGFFPLLLPHVIPGTAMIDRVPVLIPLLAAGYLLLVYGLLTVVQRRRV